MFKKILVANRGVIAARIIRTCREMGIWTIALYTDTDRESLHVRLANECVQIPSASDLFNIELILEIARGRDVDAIHPGLGFLAEEAEFIRACDAADIRFIGPPAGVVEVLRNKINAQDMANAAGFLTPQNSARSFGSLDFSAVEDVAKELGYPIIIKSCSGGRGRGERLAMAPEQLQEAVRQSQAISLAVYGNQEIYLERAILPAYQIGVQIMADQHGNLVHLGEREGSVLANGMKIVEEAPARCLAPKQRHKLWQTALEIARLFQYEGLGTVEFLVDVDGQFFFSEIKARIQVEHALTEMLTRLDLVREQICLAAGESLPVRQEDIESKGWAMMARIRANDPWRDHMPSPGTLRQVRLPAGPEVRVDTYVHSGCEVPAEFDPLLANLTVWADTRERCLARHQRSLEDFVVLGTMTNLPLLQKIATHEQFKEGTYTTDLQVDIRDVEPAPYPDEHIRNLAAAAAVLYLRRQGLHSPEAPSRLSGGWHSSSRRLPE
jgi:acetyl/propionyl-CoA carboxylase alpha subunit